jgi:hypothetical protein
MTKVWVVMFSRYDDWELLGVGDSQEQAKEIKRSAAPRLRESNPFTHIDELFKSIHITEVELGAVII